MGQKRDLTDTEKSKIVKYHSDGHNTLEIAKYLDNNQPFYREYSTGTQKTKREENAQINSKNLVKN